MNYRILDWGPHVMVTKIDKDFSSFLDFLSENNEKREKANHLLAGKIESEFSFTDKEKKALQAYMEKYVRLYLRLLLDKKSKSALSKMEFDQTQSLHGLAEILNLKLDNAWINKQKKNEYNPIHAHTGHISFVVYQFIDHSMYSNIDEVDVKPGTITFFSHGNNGYHVQNENPMLERILGLMKPISENTVLPEKDMILLFPSYLQHFVDRFTADVERVSISGNYYLGP